MGMDRARHAPEREHHRTGDRARYRRSNPTWACGAGSVRVIPDAARADRFTMRVIEKDPHAAPIPWPGMTSTSITRPAELGVSEDGQPVRVLFLRRHALIGGTTGAGKSGIVNVILAHLAACRDVVIWAVDMKGGMELRPWARVYSAARLHPRAGHRIVPRRGHRS